MSALNAPDQFFAELKAVAGPLDQIQVDVTNALLTGEADDKWPIGWVAYGMATAYHEARLRPCDEIGKGAGHPYGRVGKYGQVPYGRGLVQLTWDTGYEWADKRLGLGGALLKNFALANQPDIAAKILIYGMESGHFTGVGLGHFITNGIGTHDQFVNCRKIINGLDRAELIAGYALHFQDGLGKAGYHA